MARQIIQLNATKIAKTKAQDKDYTISDGNGLYLLVKTTGSKLWRFNYYDIAKKRKLMSLGSYPEISLAEARAKRDEYRTLVAQGVDPQDYLFKQKEAAIFHKINTVRAVAEDWKALKAAKVAPDTLKDQWARLENYLFPHIENLPISDITAPFIRAKLQYLADLKRYETLKKVIRGMNEIMRFAVNGGVIKYNPLADINELYPSSERISFPSIHPSQLPELLQTVNRSRITLQTRCLFEWQLLTMVRPAEAAGTRWDEIDFENAVWNIPKERMKGAKAKKRPHSVPLSKQALAILDLIRPLTGHCAFVFPKNGDMKGHMSNEAVNKMLNKLGRVDLCS